MRLFLILFLLFLPVSVMAQEYIPSPLQSPSGSVNHVGGFVVNRDVRIPNTYIVTKIGFYHGGGATDLYIVKRNSAGNFTIERHESFTHGGGWQDVTLSSPFEVPATGDYYVAYYTVNNIPYTSGVARSYFFGTKPTSGTVTSLTENTGTTGAVRAYIQLPTVSEGTFDVMGVFRKHCTTGWGVIDDTDHQPLNITGVSDQGSVLRLTYGQTADQVGTLIVSPDEQYVQSDYHAGSSVGLSYADIQFAQDGVAKTPAQVPCNNSGNFWVYGKMWKD